MSNSSRFPVSAGKLAAMCPVHLVFEQVRGDLQLCSHTKESRVKNLTPTETVFPWNIEQFKEKMKHYPDSPNRKVVRDYFLKSNEISCSHRQHLKCWSKNAEQREQTVLFVNFKDKCSPVEWRLAILTLDTKHHEENKPGFMKNWAQRDRAPSR